MATVVCSRCRLTILCGHEAGGEPLRDLLATHWFDDHHLPAWQAEAARARSRLWKSAPNLLHQLTQYSKAHAADAG